MLKHIIPALLLVLLAGSSACSATKGSPTPPASYNNMPSGSPTPISSPAQLPSVWTRTYGVTGENESAGAVLTPAAGGLLLVGLQSHYSEVERRDLYQTYLLRTDADGQLMWRQTIDEYQAGTQFCAAFETNDQGFLIFETRLLPSTAQTNNEYEQVWIKADQNGNRVWSEAVQAGIITFRPAVGHSARGFTVSGPNSSGTELVVIELDGNGYETGRKLQPLPANGSDYQDWTSYKTANGDFLIAAKKITGDRQSDIFAARLDENRETIWSRTYHAEGFQLMPWQILENTQSEITVVGTGGPTGDYFRPYAQLYVLKLDSQGTPLWSLIRGDIRHRLTALSAVESGDGGYLVTGQNSLLTPFPGTGYILKLDKDGKVQWERTLGEPGTGLYGSQVDSATPTSDDFVVAGEVGTLASRSPGRDSFLMKISPEGRLDKGPFDAFTAATPTPPQTSPVFRTIEVDQSATVNSITLTLEKIVVTATGFNVVLLYVPPGYDRVTGTPSSIPGPQAEYNLDGAPAKGLLTPPPFSLTDQGIEYTWLSDEALPEGAKELVVRVTRFGQQPGTWEFHVPLSPTPTGAPHPGINIDWVDFIRLNDITYLNETVQPISFPAGDLSVYAQIKFKTAGVIMEPGYKLKNGDAAYLEIGTTIYAIKGYMPQFRLLAFTGSQQLIFEADSNPNAKVGADLMDIGGKVTSIGILSADDGKTELASIKDAKRIAELVQMVLDAPVNQSSPHYGSERYLLEFHLSDSTSVRRMYSFGELERGITLPPEFAQAIRSAIAQ